MLFLVTVVSPLFFFIITCGLLYVCTYVFFFIFFFLFFILIIYIYLSLKVTSLLIYFTFTITNILRLIITFNTILASSRFKFQVPALYNYVSSLRIRKERTFPLFCWNVCACKRMYVCVYVCMCMSLRA